MVAWQLCLVCAIFWVWRWFPSGFLLCVLLRYSSLWDVVLIVIFGFWWVCRLWWLCGFWVVAFVCWCIITLFVLGWWLNLVCAAWGVPFACGGLWRAFSGGFLNYLVGLV